ncbi:MAG TPA: hypothetical protein VNM34_12050 [Verrucomicrobiae bacterium]|nr:hypothetical protein [Verrucomicrobiae bacterium]
MTAKAPSKPSTTAKRTDVIVVPAAFDAHNGAMTPAVAVTRHLEWLDYALAAARAEETWRRGRLDKATKKNRSKREARLTEVLAEIDELAALLKGLRSLQTASATKTSTRRRGGPGRATRRSSTSGPRRRTTTTTNGAG